MSEASSRRSVDRREAIRHDIDTGGRGDTQWARVIITDDNLKKIGISRFKAPGNKDAGVDYFLNVIPPHPDDGSFLALKLYRHYHVGANDGTYLCPSFMAGVFKAYGLPIPEQLAGGKCPICEKRLAMRSELKALKERNPTGEYTALEKEISALNFSLSYLSWVVDARDETASAKGVMLWEMPKTVYDGVLGVSRDRRTGQITDITDPDNGKTFVFTRHGTGPFDTEYNAFDVEDRAPIPDAWLDAVPRYTDVLVMASYDTIREAFYGSAGEQPTRPAASGGSTTEELKQGIEQGRRARTTQPAAAPAVQQAAAAPAKEENNVVFDEPAPAAQQAAQPQVSARRAAAQQGATAASTPAPEASAGLDNVRARLRARQQAAVPAAASDVPAAPGDEEIPF